MALWSRLFGVGEAARDLVADLVEDYRAEAEQAAHLRLHAERARYPQGAEALRRLADLEARHAGWLKERITVLGGTLPALQSIPPPGTNQWERAVSALQAAQRKRKRLVEQIAHWDPDEPEIVDLLRRIETEDLAEQATYEHLIMRSDPHAID
jgi:bacterioferritin (cytochrome b1)